MRLPIGGLFAVLGLVIGGFGIATAGDAERYARSASVNVNVWWGGVMLVFGLLLLWLGIRSRRLEGPSPPLESAEGRAVEAREHERGLER